MLYPTLSVWQSTRHIKGHLSKKSLTTKLLALKLNTRDIYNSYLPQFSGNYFLKYINIQLLWHVLIHSFAFNMLNRTTFQTKYEPHKM
jgi:hypothetical protein